MKHAPEKPKKRGLPGTRRKTSTPAATPAAPTTAEQVERSNRQPGPIGHPAERGVADAPGRVVTPGPARRKKA